MLTEVGILVFNTGSSSIRLAVFDSAARTRLWSARAESVGRQDGRIVIEGAGLSLPCEIDTFDAGFDLLLTQLGQTYDDATWLGVGHRFVHGGEAFSAPQIITGEIEQRLQSLAPLAPLHMPQSLAGVAAVRKRWPHASQVASFDTAFHASLPARARVLALPQELLGAEVRRYGFHGLSYQSILLALTEAGVEVEGERILIAHLGAGASMCAIAGGQSVETTMGFSTLAGLPMATRCGDIDPGALLHILADTSLSPNELRRALYQDSGLKALAGLDGDMKQLLAHRLEPAAALAIEVFCYAARRSIASLAAAMGGLDRLVFTGGIGERADAIRTEICAGLEFLGVELDARANSAGQTKLSPEGARVLVEARTSNEEGVIARHVAALTGQS
ncbi:MAG: acetate/propionate family kinase [Hydrogenophilaceae bacterium]|nr:acetate/propionate family kinase [Hydrogenophilaceae bacterium]